MEGFEGKDDDERVEGGSLENLEICCHFSMRSLMVLFNPRLDWTSPVNCSVLICLSSWSKSILWLRCYSLATRYESSSSSSSYLLRASLSSRSLLSIYMEIFSNYNSEFLDTDWTSFKMTVSLLDYFYFSSLTFFLS